jgi:ABC-type branched-subunit amino acid transport system ATPase component
MLRLRSVRVRFGDQLVLRDVSFQIEPAQTVVLIGRNGAGKTTTLRTIMGLLPLQDGRITLDDLDLVAIPSHERARHGIGYAPEDRRLIPDFSVEDNLLLPGIALRLPERERKRRLDEIYALLPELVALRNRPGGVLSGGQGKIAALGRALMVGRRYVLLDEPFQGLAPALALSYATTLARLREQRGELGFLITESSAKFLGSIADRMLQIERGEIEQTATSVADHTPAAGANSSSP